MEKEIWKDIAGYEGLYQVSNFGRVKSLNYNRTGQARILKAKTSSPYDQVSLWNKGKMKYATIHRLVAVAFLSQEDGKNYVNHKNGDKRDNRAGNLEWCTCSENAIHSVQVLRQSPGDYSRKAVICIETGEVFRSQVEAAKAYHTSQGAIGNATRKNRPRAGGFHWRFA